VRCGLQNEAAVIFSFVFMKGQGHMVMGICIEGAVSCIAFGPWGLAWVG
jgi:hypothetical protein